MININEQGIGYTDFANISENQKNFIEYLFKTRIDFIIDCTKVVPRKEFIEKLFVHQKNVEKCFVIVISTPLLIGPGCNMIIFFLSFSMHSLLIPKF